MKITHCLLILPLIAALSCEKSETPIQQEDQSFTIQIPVKFGEDLTKSTKVSIYDLSFIWESGDKIGFFAGSKNSNVPFSISEGTGSRQAVFSGTVNAFSMQTVYAVYPYTEAMTDVTDWPVTLRGQEYDGDYTKSFSSKNIREHFHMASGMKNASVSKTSGWPSASKLGFIPFAGLLRYDISSSMSRDFTVDEIYIHTPGGYKLMEMDSINLEESSFGGYYTDKLGVSLPYGGTGRLTMKSGEPGTHKYVSMVVAKSFFTTEDMDLNIVLSGTIDGRRVRVTCPKKVNSGMNFNMGKLSELAVPLTDDLAAEYSNTVKVTSSGDCLTSPIFGVTDSYEAGKTYWGDDSGEAFLSARKHDYSDTGVHTASFDCWGKCSTVTFETLENVSEIDFSKF